jgi:hypothetical protein
MNTRNYEIDDLLEKISPELIARYEQVTLGGESLKNIHKKYEEVLSQKCKYNSAATFFQSVFILVLAAGLIFLRYPWVFAVAAIASFACGVYCISRVKYLAELSLACEQRLEDFIDASQGLKHPIIQVEEGYSEANVKHNLVCHAYQILVAEKRLDRVRLQKERRLLDLLGCASLLSNCQHAFSIAMRRVEKFGLKFDREELFAWANKIVQMDEP